MRKFIVILLGFGIWGLGFALPLKAACYCQDPSVCRCSTAAPVKKNPASTGPGGIAVYCDTPEEAMSLDAIRAPICGSSPEVISKCAKGVGGNESYWTCWGSSVATGTTSLSPLPNPGQPKTYKITGQFVFNGSKPLGVAGTNDILVCAENLICCGNVSNCFAGDIPQTPTSCPDQNINITPPVSICGVVAGNPNTQPNFTGQSDTDARIYFPHVKNTSSITYLLQSMFRPISWTIDEIKKNVVYSKIFEHQGLNPGDNTPVINTTDNNSSVIPNRPAPSPVFDFSHPPAGVPDNGSCVVSNVRVNPGDDLLGKKILADLEYTQKFQYQSLVTPNCVKTGRSISPQRVKDNSRGEGCCSGSASCSTNPDTGIETCTCNPFWINLPTKGKTLVYTKSPFLEYLYQNLVAGPAAIYKRFVSASTAAEIKDIPSQATYLATANEITRGSSNLKDTPTQIYFPHLGSVYDYFLKNLQKLLRPKDTADTTTLSTPPFNYGPGTTTSAGSCGTFDQQGVVTAIRSVSQKYQVPASLLVAIYEIESLPYITGKAPYSCVEDGANAQGPMQITRGTYASITCTAEKSSGQCTPGDITTLSRCDPTDSVELAARTLLLKAGKWNSINCKATGSIDVSDKLAVYNAANSYYGSCQPDNLTSAYSYNLSDTRRVGGSMNYGDIVCNKMDLCPPYPEPQCTPQSTITPSSICSQVGNGPGTLPNSNFCFTCKDGKFVNTENCKQ